MDNNLYWRRQLPRYLKTYTHSFLDLISLFNMTVEKLNLFELRDNELEVLGSKLDEGEKLFKQLITDICH